MATGKKIALTYYYSENWVAGSYYVQNVIRAFKSLPDAERPQLVILYEKEQGLDEVKAIGYPYIDYVNTSPGNKGLLYRLARKVSVVLFKRDLLLERRLSGTQYLFEGSEHFAFIPNHYYWVHDFQQCRLPGFFSQEEADARSALPRKVAQMDDATLILSSYDALNDFNTFFPGYKCRVKVLRFASSLPDLSGIDYSASRREFDIREPFFLCSNQFWQHKNHQVVLDAIRLLKGKDLSFQVVFTGKTYDYRTPEYFPRLEAFVKQHQLECRVKFLGFIDRKVQLSLAQHALSYIQPSLFEGWSTTVEDAKYLNKFVLLSDIPVHREQMKENVAFFNPADAADLAAKMERVLAQPPVIVRTDYQKNIETFGRDLNEAFSIS
ncbi:MAG TPA: glycosyltransferase [Puia sp.]|nr:glycosyltransferase [Puia sp.]